MFAHVGVIVGAIVIKPALTSLFHLERSNVVPVTMRDVARKAGVSIRTVSRAIQKQGEITQETRQRVLAAVEELGYRPSKVARALVTDRAEAISPRLEQAVEATQRPLSEYPKSLYHLSASVC